MSESLPEYRGKVRDIYPIDDDKLLFVASDRVSAYDVVFDKPVPHKGAVLTAMTLFWLQRLGGIAPSHLVTSDVSEFADQLPLIDDLDKRSMIVSRADMLPVECVVRGYLAGSIWEEYQQNGTATGISLPGGLPEAAQLPEAIFTPATKAPLGQHDENISFDEMVAITGPEVATQARDISLALYNSAAVYAAERGIIIADTKFELGFIAGQLCVCDEVLTPDSSRLWPAELWQPGTMPPSLDKQPLRDWAEATGWDKQPPAPSLPSTVVEATSTRYLEAYQQLTGHPLS